MVILTFLQTETAAIPEFARKYNTSCTTCHVAITKRNEFGEAFRRNGYILPSHDAERVAEKPVKLGAEAWKQMWPDAIWPGELPADFPIAALTIMRLNYDLQNDDEENKINFDMPLIFNLLFGGAFGEDISFFGEWSAYAFGVNARGLQRFFFQFNSIFGPDNLFNIRVGRFEPGITDGYTSTQRLTSDYQVTIDYDPSGYWKPRDPQSGIELNGIYSHRVYYSIGVVNGESKTIADKSNQKDLYARIAYQFNGDGFDGKDIYAVPGVIKNSENFVTIGSYGYWGSTDKIPLNNITYDNKFQRYGFDVYLHLSDFDLLGGLILGNDDNPDNSLQNLKSSAYFIEGNYSFYPWLIGILRVERASSWKLNEDRDKYINIIPNITLLYRANVRFSIEGLINIQNDKNINNTVISFPNNKPLQHVTLNAMIAF